MRMVVVLGIMAILIAIAWQIENWRGTNPWEKTKGDLLAQTREAGLFIDRMVTAFEQPGCQWYPPTNFSESHQFNLPMASNAADFMVLLFSDWEKSESQVNRLEVFLRSLRPGVRGRSSGAGACCKPRFAMRSRGGSAGRASGSAGGAG